MKVKFANAEVPIKELVKGAVVLECEDGYDPEIYHIHRFQCFNGADSSVDLVVVNDTGKWPKNSTGLTWPI